MAGSEFDRMARLPLRPTTPKPQASEGGERGFTSSNLQQALQQARPKPGNGGSAQAETDRPSIADRRS